MSSSHKHKLDLQPFVEEMYEELECEKTVIKKFRKYYNKMVGISLEQGGSRLGKLNENEKATWLVPTYRFDTITNVSRTMQLCLLV